MATNFYPLTLFNSAFSDPKSVTGTKITVPLSLPEGSPSPAPDPLSDPDASRKKSGNYKGSAQLNRWSRVRALRSGRRRDRSVSLKERSSPSLLLTPPALTEEEEKAILVAEDDGGGGGPSASGAKTIYMVSDGTGWTAEHSVSAALGQFDYCLVDRGCPVNTYLFSGVEDVDQLMEIVKQAAMEGALLLYTLADPSMADSAKKACQLWGVPYTDILGPTIEAIAVHLGVAPSGLPRGASGRKIPLTDEYFRRIEAIDFTIKHDDGAQPKNLSQAHIVLTGVSRTGKTPLSIYLAQKGYKVANVPIVAGVELPKSLFDIDQEKIFGLTINPLVLQTIRKTRAKSLGFSAEMSSNYSNMDHVRQELEFAGRIFKQNPLWPVIEVTGKAIEETAAVVVRIYHDRKQKCSMPRISKRY